MPANSLVSSHERIVFDQLASFSRLFSQYTRYADDISPFFNGDFRKPASFETATQRTLQIDRNRDLIADVLLDQNTRWGLDAEVEKNIERLRQDNAVVVITGQQLGLFLSPLFIPYKTITTLLLANQLQEQLNRPVIPVFWLHGEDHDFAETTPIHVIDANHELVSLNYAPEPLPPPGPVGRMTFTSDIDRILADLEATLPQTPNKNQLFGFLRAHFRPGASLIDAFAFFLKRTFSNSGLVLFSVDDKRIKQTCADLFHREISHPADIPRAVTQSSTALEETFHVQVKVNPINLFMMDDTSRLAINEREDTFYIKGNNEPITQNNLLDILSRHPERFSPNVILRPIVQDFIFPSIAYVAGPGEIAYFAQLKGAYDVAGIPMPLIYPRASLTLIEPAVDKVLHRYDYPLSSYNEDPDKLFRKHAIRNLPINVDALIETAVEGLNETMDALRDEANKVSPSLDISAKSTKARFRKQLEKYGEQIIKAQKRTQLEDRVRLKKAAVHLYPLQKSQERVLSPLHFMNQYGLDFFNNLRDEISIDTTAHQIIRL